MQTEADAHSGERCVKTSKPIRIVGTAGPVNLGSQRFDFTGASYPKTVRGSGSQCRVLDRIPIWAAHHAINRRGTNPVRRDGAGSMMGSVANFA